MKDVLYVEKLASSVYNILSCKEKPPASSLDAKCYTRKITDHYEDAAARLLDHVAACPEFASASFLSASYESLCTHQEILMSNEAPRVWNLSRLQEERRLGSSLCLQPQPHYGRVGSHELSSVVFGDPFITKLGRHEIRLLRLMPKTPGARSDLACVVSNFIINIAPETRKRTAPPFVALSYCWGDESGEKFIDCYGSQVKCIRENLYHLLTRLRDHDFWDWIWVDAICINQESDHEKSHQIPLMKDIFSESVMTLGWLGEPPYLLKPVWEQCEKLQDIYMKAVTGSINVIDNDVEWPSNDFWLGLEFLFSNQYFKRVWILQEVVIARKLFLMSGDDLFDSTSLFVIAGCCSLIGSMEYFSSISEVRRSAQLSAITLNHLGELRTLFHQNYPKNQPIYVSSIIQHSQSRLATKLSDHVFGILGLLDRKTLESLIIDVRRTPSQVYTDFMAGLLKGDGLGMCNQLRRAGMRENDDGLKLPSWCIDFSKQAETESLRVISDSTYKVGGGSKLSAKQQVSVDNLKLTIRVLGWRVAVVKESLRFEPYRIASDTGIKDSLMVSIAVARALDDCYDMTTMFGTKDDLAIATTISAECRLSRPAPGVPRRPRVDEFMEWRQQMSEHMSRIYDYGRTAPAVHMNSFGQGVPRACRNRAFFCTTDGRVGLGPKHIQPKDIICAIFGSDTLLAFRPSDSGGKSCFVLLGECFCHGLNFGELEEISKTQNLKTQEFVIQ